MAAFRPDPPRSITPAAPPSAAPRGVAAPVARVIEAFRRLPGIGPKSAQRLAYHLVRMPEAEAAELSEAITGVKQRIKLCETCADITEEPTCHICADPNRDQSTICVVEEPLDVTAFERTPRLQRPLPRPPRCHLTHQRHRRLRPQDQRTPPTPTSRQPQSKQYPK